MLKGIIDAKHLCIWESYFFSEAGVRAGWHFGARMTETKGCEPWSSQPSVV